MKKKLYALIVSALAVVMTAPAFALTAFAAPEDNTDEVEAADAAEEETQETEPPVPQDTKPFDAEEFLESYTTATTYDYYGDPYYDTDGNASLISDKHVIYSSDQIQFISVATKDGHVFYIVIDYTDTDGDNVYFLNKVDDFDMYRLLYAGKEDDEDTNIVEEYEAQQGNTALAAPVDNQKQGTRKTEATTPTEPADKQSGGLSTETMFYLITGGLFIIALAIVCVVKLTGAKKRVPTDDFDDDDDDADITGSSGEYEIK